jgi:DNA-binding response OmpR family regulator
MVCEFVRRVLIQRGYDLLIAKSGEEALQIAAEYKAPIDLLLTDHQLGGITGRELNQHMSQLRSDFEVVYMSGLADDFLDKNGKLESGIHFLQKPFCIEELIGRVKSALKKS